VASQRETPLSHSFCKHLVETGKPLIVPDAREHPILSDNPAIAESNVIAYLGIPLTTAEGQTIGSFCVIDAKPRKWSQIEIDAMEYLAAGVMVEIELRLLVRHFQQNCLRLRELELAREEMTQMLVHDLRNPLSALILSLSILKEEKACLPASCLQSLGNAENGAMVLSRMVNDFLDVSKSEAGKLELNLSKVYPGELVHAACAPIIELISRGGIALIISIDPTITSFSADHEKLRRTLVNLISNAAQHTPENGQIAVEVRREPGAGNIVIEISDNGSGIPKEAFAVIFEKFHRSVMPNGLKTSTGLGLPFCKKAVEAHGGNITVESEVGKGTTFRVQIPERLAEPALV
jgi:signal transduction histidine kinase